MVVQDQASPPLVATSRLNFGIHHPIQYNVKVKDLGSVASAHIPLLRAYCGMQNQDTGVETTGMSTSDMQIDNKEDDSIDEEEEASNVEMTNIQTTSLIAPVSSQVYGLPNTMNDEHISTAACRSPESKPLPEQDISLSVAERLEHLRATVRLDPGKIVNIEQGIN